MGFKPRVPLKIAVFLLLSAVVFLVSWSGLFKVQELFFYDSFFRARTPLEISPDIVIIEISDDTLKNLGQWPLPRDYHASLIDILKNFGARMVVFDIFFSEPTFYDDLFKESMKRFSKTYLPLVLDIDTRPSQKGIPQASRILADSSIFEGYFKATGHINTFVDPDGKIRRIPLFIKYNRKLIPHLSLKLACDYLGIDLNKVNFGHYFVNIGDKISLPVERGGTFIVNYPSTWRRSFKHISYFQVLKSWADIKEGIKPSLDLNILKDKVCFVGLTATGTQDIKPMPLENLYPMVGLQASVFNSIVKGQFIIILPPLLRALIVLFWFWLGLYIVLKLKPLLGLGVLGAANALYLAVAFLVFVFKGLWLGVFTLLFISLAVYLGCTLYRFLAEIKKRLTLERELEIARDIQKKFLPQNVGDFKNVKISHFMKPAKFVAGDLYDILVLDEDRLGVFVGDVSGKGVPAALIMAQAISLFRVLARREESPAKLLGELNKQLCQILGGRFVTAFYLTVDTKKNELVFSSAGHCPLLFYNSKEGRVEEIGEPSGLPLGILEDFVYTDSRISIREEDKVILYTDGVTEARNKRGEEFGLGKFKEIILQNKGSTAQEIMEEFKEAVFVFYKGLVQHDDITILLLDFSS